MRTGQIGGIRKPGSLLGSFQTPPEKDSKLRRHSQAGQNRAGNHPKSSQSVFEGMLFHFNPAKTQAPCRHSRYQPSHVTAESPRPQRWRQLQLPSRVPNARTETKRRGEFCLWISYLDVPGPSGPLLTFSGCGNYHSAQGETAKEPDGLREPGSAYSPGC